MINLINFSKAISWLILCVIAAFFLLAVALTYNGYIVLKKGFVKATPFPKLQVAR